MTPIRKEENLNADAVRAAIGSVMRAAEQDGLITPCDDFSDFVHATGYSAEEIDEGLDLLVDARGRVLGLSVAPVDADLHWRERLLRAGLISREPDGRLEIAEKGEVMLRLLHVYGDPLRIWRRASSMPRQLETT